MSEDVIEFTRKKPFKKIKNIGEGAFGKTVLLRDENIDEDFVCKKYSPFLDKHKEEYYKNFKDEIKLLHMLYHKNIVRIFNYYLYPEYFTGYILMEYIQGEDIEKYIEKSPEQINDIFFQLINGFKYLEEHNILHRDIRPHNIMVENSGLVKIIDFGFGKKVHYKKDFDKSITLNWWCETPDDFLNKIYNFKTEVYFIGKLIEKIIVEQNIQEFKFKELLSDMTHKNPVNRIESFNNCYKKILNEKALDINFNGFEIQLYREFSNTLYSILSTIESSTKFINDSDKILRKLELLYKNIMLEEFLPSPVLLCRCFLDGEYTYNQHYSIEVNLIKDFINLFKSLSKSKKNIIINNLDTRLEVVERYDKFDADDIPF